MRRIGGRITLWMALAALAAAAPARADVVDDNPAAASRGPGDMHVFARAADGAVLTRSREGAGWGPWRSLGGNVSSGIAATARGTELHIAARGADDAVWVNSFDGANWSGWKSLGGVATSAPAISVRRGTEYMDLAVRGAANDIWHYWWSPSTGWRGGGSLGGVLTSAPALNSQADNVVNVFARGPDGALWQTWWGPPGFAWSGWFTLGGVLTAAPALVSRQAGVINVYVRGTYRALYQRTWTPAGWSGWVQHDDGIVDSAPAVASEGSDSETLFARRGNSLVTKTWAGSWSAWQDLGPVALPAPAPPPGPPPGDGAVLLEAGLRCTPPGGLLAVNVKIRRRKGRPTARVSKVVFFVRDGPRRTDRRRPFRMRLRLNFAAGTKGRVFARVYYRRKGSHKLRRKTVSRRFVMCG